MNEQDLIQLSAYIDGELTETERVALEVRLQDEPDLQVELESLRQTVALVRNMPTLKAPRDYTLNPADYARTPRAKVIPLRRWIPMAAAILVVLMVGVLVATVFNDTTSDTAQESMSDAPAAVFREGTEEIGTDGGVTDTLATATPLPTQSTGEIAAAPTMEALATQPAPTVNEQQAIEATSLADGSEPPPPAPPGSDMAETADDDFGAASNQDEASTGIMVLPTSTVILDAVPADPATTNQYAPDDRVEAEAPEAPSEGLGGAAESSVAPEPLQESDGDMTFDMADDAESEAGEISQPSPEVASAPAKLLSVIIQAWFDALQNAIQNLFR